MVVVQSIGVVPVHALQVIHLCCHLQIHCIVKIVVAVVVMVKEEWIDVEEEIV